jgi:putative aldouronate transport system permease protein
VIKEGTELANNQNNKTRSAAPVMPKKYNLGAQILKYKYFYLMFLPVFVLTVIFKYVPMLGIRFAFTKYGPFAPPKYIGFKNFETLLVNPKFIAAFKNTIFLSLGNLILSTIITVIFALLMNELYNKLFKSFVQTVLYLPHFISWVVTASIFYLILSPDNGFINQVLGTFGIEPKYFLIEEKWWTPIYYFINRWKDTGWGTIIYLAALSGINTELYEAAAMDGAGRLKQTWYVTIPGILNTILVVFILNLAKIMNLFESVFVMQNPMVLSVSEVIKTYNYKVGLQQSDYGYSTAVGLFNSLIAMVLVLTADKVSKKIKGSGIL